MDSRPPSPDNSEYANSSSTMEEDQVDIELQGETEQILAIEVNCTQEVCYVLNPRTGPDVRSTARR